MVMEDTKRRAVVLAAGGDPPESPSHRYILDLVRPEDILVAADGGAEVAMRLGLEVQAVVGDLDSLSGAVREQILEKEGQTIVRFPCDKDRTDGQLALEYILEDCVSIDEIIVCGALGGRMDHGLALILFTAQLARDQPESPPIILTDGGQRAQAFASEITVHGRPGDTVSFIPLTPQVTGIYLEGFRYPLVGASLSWGQTLGVSNVLQSQQARAFIRGAGVLLFIQQLSE